MGFMAGEKKNQVHYIKYVSIFIKINQLFLQKYIIKFSHYLQMMHVAANKTALLLLFYFLKYFYCTFWWAILRTNAKDFKFKDLWNKNIITKIKIKISCSKLDGRPQKDVFRCWPQNLLMLAILEKGFFQM